MKKSLSILALSLAIVITGFSQTKGPKYKNAKPSVKYDGETSVIVKENPNQFQAVEYKNLNTRKYDKVILNSGEKQMPQPDMIVSTEANKTYASDGEEKEQIIYRRLETKDMKGKNTLGLKGPAYKNKKH